tara:strand:- start:9 stop:371 length:363 start_codon:yes stop_codon:yes gene_type:complete
LLNADTNTGIEPASPTMTTKIQPSFFYEPKENLLTGEETPLDLLLNGFILSNDVQDIINGFLDEEPEHPYMGHDGLSYLDCHDDLLNRYVFPIEDDEKHCYQQEFADDFVIDEIDFYDSD